MKNIKKVLICLLFLVTLMAFSSVAFAAEKTSLPELDGITLSNKSKGVLIKWDIPEKADSFVVMRKTEGTDFKKITKLGKEKSYLDETAKPGVSYTYAVQPCKGKAAGESAEASVTRLNQPKLVSIRSTTTGVEVNWNKVKGADRYTVYYKVSGDKKWTRITHTGNTDTYLHKNAPDGKTLIYTVLARKGSSNSSYDSKGLTINYLKTPAVKSICSVINGIKLTWEKTDAAESYIIYRRGAKETWYHLTSVSAKEKSYTDTSAIPGKTYAYTVRAVRGEQNSLYTTGKAYRYIPVNDITAVNTLCKGLTLKWESSPYASKYKLMRKTGDGELELIATLKSDTLSYNDTTAKYGKSYTYVLVTVNGSYESATDTIGRTYTCMKPPKATGATIAAKGYTVTWNKVSGANRYYVYRKEEGSKKWTKIARVANTSSYNDASADKSKTYYYCIRSSDSGKFFSNYGSSVKSSRIDPKKKMIAITYDDGPHNTNTNRILDTFEKYNARATFFVVGNRITDNSAPLSRAAKLGCEIGSHTYDHMYIANHTDSEIKANLKKTDDLIKKYTGQTTTIMRPPGGVYNSRSAVATGKAVIMWSVDTRDWESRNAAKIVSHIKNYVYDGSIILMHDLYESTASATETIVPWLLNNGYQLVTVSELLRYRGVNIQAGSVYNQARPK